MAPPFLVNPLDVNTVNAEHRKYIPNCGVTEGIEKPTPNKKQKLSHHSEILLLETI